MIHNEGLIVWGNMEGAVERLQTSPFSAEDFVFWIWRAPFPELHRFVHFLSQLLSEQSSFSCARLCYFHTDFPFIHWFMLHRLESYIPILPIFTVSPTLSPTFSLLMACPIFRCQGLMRMDASSAWRAICARGTWWPSLQRQCGWHPVTMSLSILSYPK